MGRGGAVGSQREAWRGRGAPRECAQSLVWPPRVSVLVPVSPALLPLLSLLVLCSQAALRTHSNHPARVPPQTPCSLLRPRVH